MDITWFRRPSEQDPGRISLGYNALDRHVIAGRATEPALVRADGGVVDFAGLLELASALGGALRSLGAGPDGPVVLALADPVDQLVASLACARLGVVFVPVAPRELAAACDRHRPAVVATSAVPELGDHVPGACLVRGVPPVDPARDVDWDVAMRAGRTEGSAVVDRAPDDPAYVVDGRQVSVRDALDRSTATGRLLATLAEGRPVDLRTVSA